MASLGVIERHNKSKSHRVASGEVGELERLLESHREPLQQESSEESAEDAALLKGDVPSPEEWQEAWASLSEKVSLRKVARMFEKRRHGCAPESELNVTRARKRLRKVLVVMAEALRRRIRRVLLEATSISLAIDAVSYTHLTLPTNSRV